MEPTPEPSRHRIHGRRASDGIQQTVVRAPKQRVTWIPRPPESASRSTADFIVAIFAITVATILIILTIGISFAGIRGKDISTYFAIITSIMTSIISALVGFLAGKGAGQAQASQQQPVIVVPPAPPEP